MLLTLRQKELATGLTVLVVVFGGFVCAELAFRMIQEAKYGTSAGLDAPVAVADEAVDTGRNAPVGKIKAGFHFDEEIQLRVPVPGQRMGRVSINSHGFRGPDIPLEKAPDTARVAFLGSSTTYDASAPEGANWPELTVERLREKGGGRSIDFINAGMPGFLSSHMQSYWERKVNRYQVDLVIILPGDMTADLQNTAVRNGFERTGIQGEDWLTRHSLLWAGIVKNAAMVRAQRTAFNIDMPFKPDKSKMIAAFKKRLGRAGEVRVTRPARDAARAAAGGSRLGTVLHAIPGDSRTDRFPGCLQYRYRGNRPGVRRPAG
jgi:hypothetical protein